MRKMPRNIKLMVFDLDGTLFDSNKHVPPDASRLLHIAQEAGVETVPCTGRPVGGISAETREAMAARRFAISSNGAAVTDLTNGQNLRLWPLELSSVLTVRRMTGNRETSFEAYYSGKSYVSESDYARSEEFFPPAMQEYYRASRVPLPELDSFILQHGDRIEKINLSFSSCRAREVIAEELKKLPGIYCTSSVSNNLELMNPHANKGVALTWLAGYLGIPIGNTVAFGDESNDIPLLTAAGFSVAMGNASQAVKDAADMVTDSNDENGIYNALSVLFGNGVGEI